MLSNDGIIDTILDMYHDENGNPCPDRTGSAGCCSRSGPSRCRRRIRLISRATFSPSSPAAATSATANANRSPASGWMTEPWCCGAANLPSPLSLPAAAPRVISSNSSPTRMPPRACRAMPNRFPRRKSRCSALGSIRVRTGRMP